VRRLEHPLDHDGDAVRRLKRSLDQDQDTVRPRGTASRQPSTGSSR
jgi:hypothetical protein